ncbi:MAG: autotransporter domain-containing protein [Rickettsiales bacterium]|nr:autotransporter domain-containing protein [Rickettsiales bacterium]
MFSPQTLALWGFLCYLFFGFNANALTLGVGDENFVTSENITEDDDGIVSSLSGEFDNYNSITNNHIITVGDEGVILSGDYNEVINSISGEIITTDSSGRGVDVDNNTNIYNYGLINTLGSSSYGIYVGGDNNVVENAGSILTEGNNGHAIYINGDDNDVSNSGNIITAEGYGVYLNGNQNNFTNSTTITTSGSASAYGIYISAGNDLASSEIEFTNVVNDGVINSEADGIYNRDAFSNIINNGVITSNVDDDDQYGVNNEATNAKIFNYGDITSNRYVFYNSNDGDGSAFYNYGNLNGDVRLGESTLYLYGGDLSGSITGNDNQGSLVVGFDFSQKNDYEELHSLRIEGESVFSIYHQLEALSIEIDDKSTLEINDGAELSGNIYGVSDGVGILDIRSDYDSDYFIGVNGNSLADVNVASGVSLKYSNTIYANNVNIDGSFDLSESDLVINGNVNATGRLGVSDGSHIINGDLVLSSGSAVESKLQNGVLGNFNVSGDLLVADNVSLEIDVSQNDEFTVSNSNFLLFSASDIGDSVVILDENIDVNGGGSNISGILRYSTKFIGSSLNLNVSRLSDFEVSNNENVKNIYNYLGGLEEKSEGSLLEFQQILNETDVDKAEAVLNEITIFPHKANLEVALKNINYLADITVERLMDFDVKKEKRDSLWIKPMAYNINQAKVGDDEAYATNAIGFVVGFDKALDDEFMVGMAANYLRSNIKSKDDLKQNIFSTLGVEIYSRKKWQDYFWDNLVALGINILSQSRALKSVGLDATSRYFSQSYLLKSVVGKNYKLNHNFDLTPTLGLNYNLVHLPKYRENGGEELNLEVDEVEASYVKSEMGLSLNFNSKLPKEFYKSDLKFTHFLAFVKASYGYLIKADKPEVKANFVNQDERFVSKISNIDRSEINLNLGFKLINEDDFVFGVKADATKRNSYNAYGILFDINQRF